MDKLNFNILADLTALSSFIPLFLLLLNYKMAASFLWRAIFFICLNSILANILSLVFAKIYMNNNPVFHFYILIEFWIISVIFYRMLINLNIKRLIIVIQGLFSVYYLSILSFDQGIWKINPYPRILANVFIIILSISYFFQTLVEMKFDVITKDHFFWFNSSFLFYFSTTFYLAIFERFIRSFDNDLIFYTWPVQLISMIIYNLILAKGIWTMRKLSS